MTFKTLPGNARTLLSYCGIVFLVGDGLDQAFPYSGVTVIHQHRWLGYWMLASAVALAARLRIANKEAATATKEVI